MGVMAHVTVFNTTRKRNTAEGQALRLLPEEDAREARSRRALLSGVKITLEGNIGDGNVEPKYRVREARWGVRRASKRLGPAYV